MSNFKFKAWVSVEAQSPDEENWHNLDGLQFSLTDWTSLEDVLFTLVGKLDDPDEIQEVLGYALDEEWIERINKEFSQ